MTSPIEAVFLGIDPALHKSGAGTLCPDYGDGLKGEEHPFEGNYVLNEFGKVLTQKERERFVDSLVEIALELKLAPVVVAETWDPPRDKKVRLVEGGFAYTKDQKWTYPTILGIGEGWGRWSAEIENADAYLREEHGLPGVIVLRATPNTWRDALFGPKRPRDTEALKIYACNYFEGVFGYAASSDISEAGCIALYGTKAPEVEELVAAWHAQRTSSRGKRKRAS